MNFAMWTFGDWIANGALAIAALGMLFIVWARWFD